MTPASQRRRCDPAAPASRAIVLLRERVRRAAEDRRAATVQAGIRTWLQLALTGGAIEDTLRDTLRRLW